MTLVHTTASAIDFTSTHSQNLPFHSSETNNNMPMLHTPPSSTTCRPPHRQIHRNRASYSCHSCRRRKVKCDRQHPTCGNCSKMTEACVYSDNTGKGAANKEKNKNRDRPATATEHKDSQFDNPESPPKRQRTNSGTSIVTASSEDDISSYRSHSRSSSLNQGDFVALNSPFQESPTLPQVPPPPPAGLLSTIIKEGELETRVNRLAEIVDQWYRFAYSHSQPNSPPPGANPEMVPSPRSSPMAHWPHSQQLTEHPRPQSLMISKQEDICSPPKSAPADLGRAHQKSPIRARSRPTSVSSTHFTSCKDGGAEDVAMGHLSIQENGRSRYVGTSFWALLSNEITELNQVLKTSNKSETTSSSSPPCGLSSPPHSRSSPSPDEDNGMGLFRVFDRSGLESNSNSAKDVLSILHSIPSKKHCEILFRSFLDGVNPIMPLIHVPTFASEWRSFWSWFPDNTHNLPSADLVDNPTFIPLLLSVLYAGAVSMSAKAVKANFGGRSKDVVMAHLFTATTTALTATAFPRSPTINSLMAYLIWQTCQIREEEPLTSCSFIGPAMRVAQQMGLHRDGSLFALSEVECEVRRRVWWHIMHLDIQGAIATGLPPLGGSSEDQYDTKMPSELRDEYIGSDTTNSDTSSGSSSSRFSPAMILALGRYETTVILRKIIVRLLGIKPPRKSDITEMGQMIYGLKAKLEERIARIPARGLPEMGFLPQQHQQHEDVDVSEREGVFNSWARIMLSMMSDRAYGVLYQPFLKSTKSRLWMHARHCAVRASHSFLRSYIHLARSPLFSAYLWYCPGTYQPLHATMILLLDLHERPLAAEAPRSRVFVDEVFSLFQSHQGEAWRMLERLRRKSACTTTATTTNTATTAVPYYVPGFGFGFEAASQEGFDMDELDRLVEEGCVQPAEVMLEHGMEHQQQQQQDFDWKEWPEWDQVFGRFVEVEDHNAVEVGTSGGWGLLESES